MSTRTDDYRQSAPAADRRAAQTSDPRIRGAYEQITRDWLALAEQVGWIDSTRPTLPVILVTGYCDHDLLKEFGDSRILQKPYTEGDLVDKIAAALN